MKAWIGLLLWFCSAAMSAQAMTLQVVKHQVFATGPVDGEDYQRFKTAFANPEVNTVVFVNSPGGDLWAALQVARMIEAKAYRTVAVGQCMSACSIMFMGGSQRRFGDALRAPFNVIGLHGAHDSMTKSVVTSIQPQIYAFYKNAMGSAFQADIINQALYEMDDSGALLRIPEKTRTEKAIVFHCKSRQTPRNKCTEHREQDGVKLGVLSDHTLEAISLPEAMKEVPQVLGKPLELVFDALPEFLEQVSQQHCGLPICRAEVQKWASQPDHKALATRSNGQGVAWAFNAPSAARSLMQAVYRCNHARNLPVGLCMAQSVNGYDVRGLYAQAQLEQQQALQDLRVPAQKHYGNEEFGGAMTSVSGYRTERLHDITPQRLPGITTIGTQELAKALLTPKPPVLIDVWGGVPQVLPTAKALLNGGEAFTDAAKEQAYQQRFAALLTLLAPDKAHPLAFYCAGRECWASVNAALRAQALGYTQVLWYRGGYSAWKEAQLPMALIAVEAVAN